MKINSLLLIFCSFFLMSCQQKKTKTSQGSNEIESPTIPIESKGEGYTDSTIKAMVNASIEQSKPIKIDSFNDLHDFQKNKVDQSQLGIFNLDTLNKYLEFNNPVSRAQTSLKLH